MASIFRRAKLERETLDLSVPESRNPKAICLDGNALEVQAIVSIVRASHYTRLEDESVFSFKGPSAVDFVKNIVCQLLSLPQEGEEMANIVEVEDTSSEIDEDEKIFEYNAFNEIDDDVEDVEDAYSWIKDFHFPRVLEDHLKTIRIPFLYGIDHKLPHFEKFASFEDDFFVSLYESTTNAAQIDGKFSAFQQSSSAWPASVKIGLVLLTPLCCLKLLLVSGRMLLSWELLFALQLLTILRRIVTSLYFVSLKIIVFIVLFGSRI